jgi:hypothetical protein
MPAHFRDPSGHVAKGHAWLVTGLPSASCTARPPGPLTVPRAKGMPHVVPPLIPAGAPPSIHLMSVSAMCFNSVVLCPLLESVF